jgi:membrane-associated phospholipid phosphatase
LVLTISGGTAQLLKRFVFSDALRPSAFMVDSDLHFVEGVQLHAHHSFPSGHTTAAFAFFGFAALFLSRRNPLLQVTFAVSAALVGYSRMYLSQHFLEDVVVGMAIGTIIFILLSLFFKRQLEVLNP